MKKKLSPPAPIPEPRERTEHRLRCRNMGMDGNCYNLSRKTRGPGFMTHILMGCDGVCRRMKMWDAQNGYKGQKFKLEYE